MHVKLFWRILSICLFSLAVFNVAAEEVTLHAGDSWVKKIKGGWKIVESDGKRFVTFDDRFKTRKGPDLKLFLSSVAMGAIGNRDKVESAGRFIALLKSAKGRQRYAIPAEVDLAVFKSLVIRCEQYTVVWGGVGL